MRTPIASYIKSFFGAGDMSFGQYSRNIITRFKEDSLFQNSVFLMISTVSMSLFGFVFWIITTRLYSTEQIGFATALISTTVLLSTFSLFGFNTGLVRYLPKSDKPNALINTALMVVTGITIIISSVYVLSITHFAPQFSSLREVPGYAILFIAFMVIVALNMLTDSVFIAYRASKYNFIEYLFFGAAKIILPVLFVALGTYGIFFAYTGSVILALGVTLYFLIRKFNYVPHFTLDTAVVKNMTAFSIGNYVANFIVGLPLLVLPTIIVTHIGATQSAYFYIASTIAALLYGIPQAASQSLLAEGSHNEEELGLFVKSAAKLIGMILIVGVAGFILLSKYVLLIFGTEYAANSRFLLIIMAITSFFVAINNISSTVLRVREKTKWLVAITIAYLAITMTFVFLLLPRGIIGIGWALLLGQAGMSILFALYFLSNKKKVSSARSLSLQ